MKKRNLTTLAEDYAATKDNRETWLNRAMHALRPSFEKVGAPLHDKIRVSVGFPLGGFIEKIGAQCFKTEVSKDGNNEIFISPLLDDATRVLGILVHELLHATDNCERKHNPEFAKLARALALEGKATATEPGDEFKRLHAPLLHDLGPYPHAAMNPTKVKKQTTRLVKVECPECGYIARVTAKWLDEAGAPICPTDKVPMEAS